MVGRNSRYGAAEGLFLTGMVTIGVSATKTVSGASINISADVDFLSVVPKGVTSAAAAGFIAEFHFFGRVLDAVTFDTNPIVVRMLLDANGYNKGPIDHLPVRGYRRIRLSKIVNNAAVTITALNVEFRKMR